jgi:hypothetical protein
MARTTLSQNFNISSLILIIVRVLIVHAVSNFKIFRSTAMRDRKLNSEVNVIMKLNLFTEPSPSWGTGNCAAPQELPSIIWNPNVQYRVYKSHPLIPILSHINPVHTILSYLSKIRFNIVHPPTSWSSQRSLSFWLFHRCPICIPLLQNSCYMPRPSHPSRLDHSKYTWRRVQVTKLLIMQFSPVSYHFIPLLSKYTQHPVLKHPQSMFVPLCRRRSFTPIQNHSQNYSFVYSNFYLTRQQTKRQKVLDWVIASITQIQSPPSIFSWI